MTRLAILAGQGDLPLAIAHAHPDALFVHFDGLSNPPDGHEALSASYERFGALFEGLRSAQVTEIVFAGGLARPALNPANFDAEMMRLAPRFMAAMQGGDDGLLRAVINAFEEAGFTVRGAHELLPDLTAVPGLLAGDAPDATAQADIARARAIIAALGPLDVGQGAVVAGGQVLGIETVQGTDAMLSFVAATDPSRRPRTPGVLVKAPKPGQDLRIDMPAIGPSTVRAAAAAGLGGIAIDAGRVLLIDRPALIAECRDTGLFLLAEAPG